MMLYSILFVLVEHQVVVEVQELTKVAVEVVLVDIELLQVLV